MIPVYIKSPLLFTMTLRYLGFYLYISTRRVNRGKEVRREEWLPWVEMVCCLGRSAFSYSVSLLHTHTPCFDLLWTNLCLSPISYTVSNGSLFSCITIPRDLLRPKESLSAQLNFYWYHELVGRRSKRDFPTIYPRFSIQRDFLMWRLSGSLRLDARKA